MDGFFHPLAEDIGEMAYLNGALVPAREAAVSPFDRAYLFAHAAYEVTAVYGGQLVDWPGHAERLERTLGGLGLPMPMAVDALKALHLELVAQNGLNEGLVYLQVTGGAYGERDFAGPVTLAPGVFLFTTSKPLIAAAARDGIRAVSVPDTRWARRDFKTTQLVSQALAYRAARAAGAATAIMHEDGLVTEAASANAWIVAQNGAIVTRDVSASILSGITRLKTMDLLQADHVIEERAFTLQEAQSALEMFTTSAGALVAPVVKLDNFEIGGGVPGPVTRRVQRLYYEAIGADVETAAPWCMD